MNRTPLPTVGEGAVRALLILVVSLGALPALAQDVQPAQQVTILARALAYDRDIKTDAGERIDIVVVHRLGHATAQPAEKIATAFKTLERNTIAGLPIRVTTIGYGTVSELDAQLKAAGADVLYIPPGLDEDVDSIVNVARTRKVTTLAGKRGYLDRGAALGVFVVGDRPSIFVNVEAAKAEGAAFSSELLKIAQTLR
jgi:hypothetical protein